MDDLVDKLNAKCKYRDLKGSMFARKWTPEDINIDDDSLESAYCAVINKGYYDYALCDICRATLEEFLKSKHSVPVQLKDIREELGKLRTDLNELKRLLQTLIEK